VCKLETFEQAFFAIYYIQGVIFRSQHQHQFTSLSSLPGLLLHKKT